MSTDLDQIRELVVAANELQTDPDGFIPLHTEDVVLVNLAGSRVLGRDTLADIYRKALDTPLAKVLTHSEIDDVRFLRPDVAIVSLTKHVSDERESGAALPERGSLTYVVRKDGETWRIALAHTTPVKG